MIKIRYKFCIVVHREKISVPDVELSFSVNSGEDVEVDADCADEVVEGTSCGELSVSLVGGTSESKN